MVMFACVTIVIVRHIRRRQKQKLEKSVVRSSARNAISIGGVMLLFGLAWIFGVLTFNSPVRTVFLYLFVICNAFQGFLLSLNLILLNEDGRHAWMYLLSCGRLYNSRSYFSSSRPVRSSPKNKSTDDSAISSKDRGSPFYKPQSGSNELVQSVSGRDCDSSGGTHSDSTKLPQGTSGDIELGVLSSDEGENDKKHFLQEERGRETVLGFVADTANICEGISNPIFEFPADESSSGESGISSIEKEGTLESPPVQVEDDIRNDFHSCTESNHAAMSAISLSSKSSQC